MSCLRTTCRLLGYLHFIRDNGLLSFITSDWVSCLTAILQVSFAKIAPFFYLGPQTIVFTLQMLNAILQFHHMSCLLLLFLLHVLTPTKELIFGRLDHQVACHRNCVRRIRCGKGNHRSYWWQRATGKLLEPSSYESSM